jgi:hypothetical protein
MDATNDDVAIALTVPAVSKQDFNPMAHAI